jgi:Ca-activated chloride channel homolog
MNLHFANAWALFLLWLAPLFALGLRLARRRRRRALESFVSATMRRRLAPSADVARHVWQGALTTLGLTLLLLAASRPQWGERDAPAFRRGRDLLILLDVSRSMLANDVHPDRLQRAKTDLQDLIRDLRDDRVGLVAFWYGASLICPPTSDYAFLRQAIDGAGPHSAPRGETNLGAALRKALEIFGDDPGSHRAILMVTDGEDLQGEGLEAAREAGLRHIPVFAVGIGSARGSTIPQSEPDRPAQVQYKGEEVVTRLDHDGLLAIARASGGAYIAVGTAGTSDLTLGDLYKRHLRNVNERDYVETLQSRRIERFQWFLLPAILCLLASALLSPGRLAVRTAASAPPHPSAQRPPRRPSGAALLLTAWLAAVGGGAVRAQNPAGTSEAAPAPQETPPPAAAPAASSADDPDAPDDLPSGRAAARRAQKLFRQESYAEAARLYQQAVDTAENPALRRTYTYNAAAALARAGDYAAAADLLQNLANRESVDDPAVVSALGAALFQAAAMPPEPRPADLAERAARLRDAADAFRRAARARTESESDRAALGAVLAALNEAQDAARHARLMEQHKDDEAARLLERLLTEQRAILADSRRVATNTAPSRIAQLEDLAQRQKDNADLWIPLAEKLGIEQARQAEQDPARQAPLAEAGRRMEQTRSAMRSAAQSLRDLETDGAELAAHSAEQEAYRFWRAIAPYDAILREDLRMQSNAVAQSAARLAGASAAAPLRPYQEAALDLTGLFADRFQRAVPPPAALSAAPNDAPDAPAATPPAMDAQTRNKIVELTAQALEVQTQALAEPTRSQAEAALPLQRRAYDLLKEIEDLLPKQESPDPTEKPQDPQEKPEDSDPSPAEGTPKPADETPKPPDKDKEREKNKEEAPEDVRRLLERALQREKEFEAEKRRRQTVPASPWERDW